MRSLRLVSLLLALALTGCPEGTPSSSAPANKESATRGGAAPAGGSSSSGVPGKLVDVDLTGAGIPATMKAPEGTTAKDSFGECEVKHGEGIHFSVTISKNRADMAKRKKEIGENTMNKLKSYLVDTPDAILYESSVAGTSEFHFLANVKAGDLDLACEDTKGPCYSKADVEKMLECVKTLAKKP